MITPTNGWVSLAPAAPISAELLTVVSYPSRVRPRLECVAALIV
jgi:hypothetical protein